VDGLLLEGLEQGVEKLALPHRLVEVGTHGRTRMLAQYVCKTLQTKTQSVLCDACRVVCRVVVCRVRSYHAWRWWVRA
jgi:hypothetical protein